MGTVDRLSTRRTTLSALWRNKKGFEMPDWFDLVLSISLGTIIFVGFLSLGGIVEQNTRHSVRQSQEEIADSIDLVNLLRTKAVHGGETMPLAELLVRIYHRPDRDAYMTWLSTTTQILDLAYGEGHWELVIRFPDTAGFFDEDGDEEQVSEATIGSPVASARASDAFIPTMDPTRQIEIILHVEGSS